MRDLGWLEAISFRNARECLENAYLLEQASQHLNRDELESALSVARSVLAKGEEGFALYAREVIADVLDRLAMRYEAVEDWENALQWRKELVAHEPSALLPRLLLAEDMIMAGNYTSAEQELWQLLSRCPLSIEGWTWMARCALHRANLPGQERSADQKEAVRTLMRFARRSWQVLRKPKWISYPSEVVVRVTVEELYDVTFAALVFTGRTHEAHQVVEGAIAVLGDNDGYLHGLRGSFSPGIQYHLNATLLLSVIDHALVERLLKLSRQCDAINALVDNGDYEQAFARLNALPADTDELLSGWTTWRERWLLFHAAENVANAQDVEAETRYIVRWRQLSPLEVFPLFRWGELMSACDHKQALRAFHHVLRRSEKCIEALIEVARIHYAHRRLRLASRFVAKAWRTLPSPDWCYYPSGSVVRDRLRKLFRLTEKLAAASGDIDRADYIRQEAETLERRC